MTQDTLSKELKISRASLALYETDKRNPDNDTLKCFASYFNVTTDFLLGQTENKNTSERISEVVSADKELFIFWETLKDRPDLQLLIQQTKDLPDNDIKQILKIIKSFEDKDSI